MDRTPAVKILRGFDDALKKGEHFLEASAGFSFFFSFSCELKLFLGDHKLPSEWAYRADNSLEDLLIDILSNTPLENPTGYITKFIIGRSKKDKKKSYMVVFVLKDGKHRGWTITIRPEITESKLNKYIKKNNYATRPMRYKNPLI